MSTMTTITDNALEQLFRLQLGTQTAVPVMQGLAQAIRFALPGTSYATQLVPATPFVDAFFPDRVALSALDQAISAAIGEDPSFWQNYATAVVCQAIEHWTTAAGIAIGGGQIEQPKTNDAVTAYANKVVTEVGIAGVYAVGANATVAQLVIDMYRQGFNIDSFENRAYQEIPEIIILHNSGLWADGPRIVFDWYGKHWAIAANKDRLDNFIRTLAQKGLPQLPNLQVETLKAFNAFLPQPQGPTYVDFPNLQTTATQSVSGGLPAYWSYMFTRGAAPGAAYFQVYSSCCAEDTIVLTAEGSERLISQIQPGDRVATPNGPREVLLVWSTPLFGRTLYEFLAPGTGPRLTSAHPIPNPAAASSAPSHWSVRPNGTRSLLPTLAARGIGTLGPGARVSTRSAADATPQICTVESVRATDMVEHGPLLYDLILAYDAPGHSAYWAGRGGVFCLISPEMPSLDDDPFVGAAVFEFLRGLAEQGVPSMDDGTPGSGNLEEDMTELRAHLYRVGVSALHQGLEVGLRSESTPSSYSLDDMPARIDAFIRGLTVLAPSQIFVIGILLELAMVALGDALRNVIQLGWRPMPALLTGGTVNESESSVLPRQHKNDAANILSVTIFELHVTAEPTPLPDLHHQLRVTACGGGISTQSASAVLGLGNSEFHQRFDFMVDFDLATLGSSPRVLIEIVRVPGCPAIAHGELDISTELAYQRRIVTLQDAFGKRLGHVYADWRLLTPDEAKRGHANGWGLESRAAFAAHLGRALVAPLLQALSAQETTAAS
jgi:hypothetical protein